MKSEEDQISEMYDKVVFAFQQVAADRGETISKSSLLKIMHKFLDISDVMGDRVVDEHLKYELDKYRREGLRPDYR